MNERLNQSEEMRDIDVKESQRIDQYLREGCGCSRECSSRFDESFLLKMRSDCAQLTHEQLDLLVMGQLLAVLSCSSDTSSNKHTPHTRIKKSSQFLFGGDKVKIINVDACRVIH